jgi:transposase-like protein
VQIKIKQLIADGPCSQTVRERRWPDGVVCPAWQSTKVITRGFADTEPARQRSACPDCHTRFDDLTATIVAGHHQPVHVWLRCRYGMGLNRSNDHMAPALDGDCRDVHQMTTPWRQGSVKKSPR